MNNIGIKQRVLFLAVVPTIVISLFLGVYFISVRVTELNQNIISKGTAVVSQLASIGQNGVFTSDFDTLRRISRNEVSKEVSSVVFYNKNGSEIASAGKIATAISQENLQENNKIQTKEYPNSIAFIAPVLLPDLILEDTAISDWVTMSSASSSVIGWVKIEIELNVTKSKIYRTLIHVGSIVLLGLAVCWLIAYRMGNDVTMPIIALTNAIAKIKQGKFNTRVKAQAKWELGELKSGINTMARSLDNAHKEMQNKIDQATLDLRKTLGTIEFQNIELEIARKNAENLSNAKSEFLATMSHELKTPLNGMLGFINVLQKTNLNREQKEFVDIVKKSSNSLLGIINEILDFSKIEAGKLQMAYEPMDLIDCIEESVTLLAPTAFEKSINLVPFIYSNVPQKIIGDSLRIKQVITNLLTNAVKFTESGSVIIRAMVEEDSNNNIEICISISDTGIGLSEEQKKRLFTAFNQATPNIAKQFGGTGLGLVICKKIVEQMQGEIDVESSPQQGSTFWFTFKAKKIEDAFVNVDNTFLQNKKILVIEPHDIARLSLLHMLKLWGGNGVGESFAKDFLTIDSINKFSAIILSVSSLDDLSEDNIALINLAKENFIKVIVLHEPATKDLDKEINELKIDACIFKPTRRKILYNNLCELFASEKNVDVDEEPIETTQEVVSKHNVKVLAVDDNSSNLKLLEVILPQSNFEITKSLSGESAINHTNRNKYDIILMDINMPGMNGISASRIIKKSSKYNKDTPIIALSAYIAKDTEKDLNLAGIYLFLHKPILEDELKNIINTALDKNKLKNVSNQINVNLTNNHFVAEHELRSFDLELSVKLAAGNEQLAYDLFVMLVKSFPEAKLKINELCYNKKYKELRDEVHKLHGACCYCGVPKLKQILKSFEKDIVNCKYTKIKQHIKLFNDEIDVIMQSADNNLKIFEDIKAKSEELV